MQCPTFPCSSVCLIVCLLATLRNNTERIFVKILSQKYLWTKKNWLNSGSHLLTDPDPDPGNLLKDSLTLRDRAFFHIFVHISGKTRRFFIKIVT